MAMNIKSEADQAPRKRQKRDDAGFLSLWHVGHRSRPVVDAAAAAAV